MKKRTKIIWSLLAVILVLIAGGVIWQWKNLRAVGGAMRYSKEELAAKIDEQKASVESTLKEYGLDAVVDFTFEEEEAIRKGEMTYEEAVEKLTQRQQEALAGSNKENDQGESSGQAGNKDSSNNSSTNNNSLPSVGGQNNGTPSSPSQEDISNKVVIQEAVNRMYALKAKYLGQLGSIERSAVSEYRALTAEQKKSGAAKSIVSKYMGPALSAQSSCDSEVAGLLSDLRSQLQARGESTEIVKTIQAAYEREKELKKAYYMSLIK